MITFKSTTVTDVKLINSLARDVFYSTYSPILSAEQLDYMFDMMYSLESLRRQIEEKGAQYFIAYRGDVSTGYISIIELDKGRYHLDKIYVLLPFQGEGLGRKLVDFATEHLRKTAGVERLYLTLNVNRNNSAIGFYKNLGFEVLRSGDFDIGNGYFMNDYIMQLIVEC